MHAEQKCLQMLFCALVSHACAWVLCTQVLSLNAIEELDFLVFISLLPAFRCSRHLLPQTQRYCVKEFEYRQQAVLFSSSCRFGVVHGNLSDRCTFSGTKIILIATHSSPFKYASCQKNTLLQTMPSSGKQRPEVPVLHQLTQQLWPRRMLPEVTLDRCQLCQPALEMSPVIEALPKTIGAQ